MPDIRISAMTPATFMNNDDIIPIVQALANFQVSKRLLLTQGLPVEPLQFVVSGGSLGFINGKDVVINVPATGSIKFVANGTVFEISATGRVTIILAAGQLIQIPYTPPNPGDWAGGVADTWNAITRLARVVSVLGTVPIP